jgi:hypothetical protein
MLCQKLYQLFIYNKQDGGTYPKKLILIPPRKQQSGFSIIPFSNGRFRIININSKQEVNKENDTIRG